MRVHDRFTAIAVDPVQRVARVHAHSVARARRLRGCEPFGPDCHCDRGQCRIIVNALRREIDRLLRGVDRFQQTKVVLIPMPTDESCEQTSPPQAIDFAARASRHKRRPTYAPPAIGVIPPAPTNSNSITGGTGASPNPKSSGQLPGIDLLA